MKKTSIVFIVFLLMKGCVSFGQVKIGNISLDSITASKYFADCYLHPDTINNRSVFECYPNTNSFMVTPEITACEEKIKEWNRELKNKSMGTVYDTVKYSAGVDTSYDGISFASFDYKKGAKSITYEKYEAGQYTIFKGYLIARNPSEDDFIKWYAKQNQ